jgi:tRNA-specific 2-thiouridylase
MVEMKGKKVYLGLSGGVDSSVSAALLLRAGYEVTGVFIRAWELPGLPCTWRAERRDAMRVAARLDIPLVTLDLSTEYKNEVVDYLIREYRAGRTPNPDVMCNRAIKFGAFYKWARAQGADYVATGHYAQTDGEHLLRAKDANKDQTYFLWTLSREQLAHILFPIGGYDKVEVRALAAKFNLSTAEKKDSQGVCFIGQFDFKDFLKTVIETTPGEVLDESGKVIGEHEGAVLYTIGERHHFNVRSRTSNMEPLYVLARDLEKNTLVVGPKTKLEATKVANLSEVNWTSGQVPAPQAALVARIRHRGELLPCHLKSDGNSCQVEFATAPGALAPGQSLVLYEGANCLGGGIIVGIC